MSYLTENVATRRAVLLGGVACAGLSVWNSASALSPSFGEFSTRTRGPFVEVSTTHGKVRGGTSRGALAFKGIPYAGPVDAANRFKEAPALEPWTGVRDALELGPPSIQTPNTTYGEFEPPYSENCLVLNIWTPAIDGKRRPVMVYNHGGAYSMGSGGSRSQDGAHLAALHDVVVVTTNHRLGLLGYLYLGEIGGEEYAASGNVGLLDIVAALGWIRNNVASFGGDPDNVMCFGESGGSFKSASLLAMPKAKGLFHKASLESGPALRRYTKSEATETALRVLHALGVSPSNLSSLSQVPSQAFVDLQVQANAGKGPLIDATRASDRRLHTAHWYTNGIAPVVDGLYMPDHPFDPEATAISSDIPLIIGNNRDEARWLNLDKPETFSMDQAAFEARLSVEFGPDAAGVAQAYRKTRPKASWTDLYIAIATAQVFGTDTQLMAERKAKQVAPVYRYICTYESNRPIKGTDTILGAGHCVEIALKFFNTDQPGMHGDGADLIPAAKNMSALWTEFARSSKPSAPGVPSWPAYDTIRRATMMIGVNCEVAFDPYADERKFWQTRN